MTRRILITGAAGNVGEVFLPRLLAEPRFADCAVRVLCRNRQPPPHPRIEVVTGDIADRAVVKRAMAGVTHVVHLATCKEDPEHIIDVTVKGMFWLLEECRNAPEFARFLLVGGDAAVGHMYLQRPLPITEEQRHTAYKGCYALSKVLEEVLLEQYQIQYDLDGCCLRAPWIMCKDDFKRQLSFAPEVFGEPLWGKLVGPEKAAQYQAEGSVPIMLDLEGKPVLRNFVHVSDLAEAMVLALDHPRARQQTFNICMDEPVNYAEVANHLQRTRGLRGIEIRVERFSNWLDNTKAKLHLGWRPQYDLPRLVDAAYEYRKPS